MTRSHVAVALALAISTTPSVGYAGDPPDAVTTYRGRANLHLMTCKMLVDIVDLKLQMKEPLKEDQDPTKCVDGGKRDLKAQYDKAMSATKKAAAKSAIKEHYVLALSALDGVLPGIDERKLAYQQRTAVAERRLEEAWNRVVVEF